jgi:NH3-dependent NAD+ synthetase
LGFTTRVVVALSGGVDSSVAAALHRDELKANWQLARQQQPLSDINPLD